MLHAFFQDMYALLDGFQLMSLIPISKVGCAYFAYWGQCAYFAWAIKPDSDPGAGQSSPSDYILHTLLLSLHILHMACIFFLRIMIHLDHQQTGVLLWHYYDIWNILSPLWHYYDTIMTLMAFTKVLLLWHIMTISWQTLLLHLWHYYYDHYDNLNILWHL